MELAPRYCRSCGSLIPVRNVCNNCNRDPLRGRNYCYDCGALTPNRDSCLKCGAIYKKKFPVKLLLIIASLLIIAILAAWFLTGHNNPLIKPQHKQISATPKVPLTTKQELPHMYDTIGNNSTDTSTLKINKQVDTTTAIKPAIKDTTKKL